MAASCSWVVRSPSRQRSGTIDKQRYPNLGGTLAVCLEIYGYRMPPGTTVAGLCRDVFGCDAAGVTRRLSGQIAVSAAELSQLVVRLGIDEDGVFPEDIALAPGTLRQKLRDGGCGIYGRAAGVRLLRSFRSYDGREGALRIVRSNTRSAGFTQMPGAMPLPPTVLHIGEAVRFECKGPTEGRLMLLDFATDGAEVVMLLPAETGGWAPVGPHGQTVHPDRMDAPLRVRPTIGKRHIGALWLAGPFAAGLDQNPVMTTPTVEPGAATEPEFRALSGTAVRAVRNALDTGVDGPVLAAAVVSYSITDW